MPTDKSTVLFEKAQKLTQSGRQSDAKPIELGNAELIPCVAEHSGGPEGPPLRLSPRLANRRGGPSGPPDKA